LIESYYCIEIGVFSEGTDVREVVNNASLARSSVENKDQPVKVNPSTPVAVNTATAPASAAKPVAAAQDKKKEVIDLTATSPTSSENQVIDLTSSDR
jgi:hypothetical protein